jgi:hypothetical protein
MLNGVLLQATQGIDEEINAISHLRVAISQQNLSSGSCMSFIRLSKLNQVNTPLVINCT